MSLRRNAGWVSFLVLFSVLAWYARYFCGEEYENILVCIWNRTFHRLNGECVYWITMRLAAWVAIYLRLLRLESGFSIYLFLRRRSYARVFAYTYGACVGIALCYYGAGTLVMAACHGAAWKASPAGLLCPAGLPQILAEEGLEALNMCLAAYAVSSLLGKKEIGFLAILAGRLTLNFFTGGERSGLPVQSAANLVMAGVVFFMAFRNFAEKYIDGGEKI